VLWSQCSWNSRESYFVGSRKIIKEIGFLSEAAEASKFIWNSRQNVVSFFSKYYISLSFSLIALFSLLLPKLKIIGYVCLCIQIIESINNTGLSSCGSISDAQTQMLDLIYTSYKGVDVDCFWCSPIWLLCIILHFLSRDQSYGDNAKSKQPTQIFSFEVYHPPLILSKHSAISRLVHISWVIIWNLILLLRFFCFFLRFSEHQAELQIKLLFFLGIIMNKSKEYLYFIL